MHFKLDNTVVLRPACTEQDYMILLGTKMIASRSGYDTIGLVVQFMAACSLHNDCLTFFGFCMRNKARK